ncbi:MAG: ribonuclease III [Candidatus Altimarinota bacterium]
MSRPSLRYERGEFEAKVGSLLSSLQILPKNSELYILACIHRSVLNEAHMGYSESNERLEFLGDAVLEVSVTEALFHEFPEKPEGELTDIRSALVRGRNLAQIAAKLGFSSAIQLSRGESLALGHENPYILANTLEAIIGAIYLEQGFDVARAFIAKHIYSTLPRILAEGLFVDPKSHLQEVTQAIWGITPTYSVAEEEGADHNKLYKISVTLDSIELGVGKGTSKKKGEQDAAENAIANRSSWEKKITLPKKVIET